VENQKNILDRFFVLIVPVAIAFVLVDIVYIYKLIGIEFAKLEICNN
jgi:hypothetical protein